MRRRENARAFVYLGIYDVAPVIRAACTALGVPTSSADDLEGRTALASFRLTRQGAYAKGSLTIGSLPWAVTLLERERGRADLEDAAFASLLNSAQGRAQSWFLSHGLLEREMTHEDLAAFEAFLREDCGCATVRCEELARVFARQGNADDEYDDEDDLLNSFFLADLEETAGEHREQRLPDVVAALFSDAVPSARRDHARDRDETFDVVQPNFLARGAWPN